MRKVTVNDGGQQITQCPALWEVDGFLKHDPDNED